MWVLNRLPTKGLGRTEARPHCLRAGVDDRIGTKTYSASMSTAAPYPPGAALHSDTPPAGRPDAARLQWLRRLNKLAQHVQRLDTRIDTLRDSLQSFETSLQALRRPHLRAVAQATRLLAQLQRLRRSLLAPPAAQVLPRPTVWGKVTGSVTPPKPDAARRRAADAADVARRPRGSSAGLFTAPVKPLPASRGLVRCDYNALPRSHLPGPQEPASEQAEGLQGPPHSRDQALKRLYRSLARRFHPDLVATAASKQRCEEQMAAINALYSRGDLERLMLLNCATVDLSELRTALPMLQLQTLKQWYRWLVGLRLRLLAELHALQKTPLAQRYHACQRGSLRHLRQTYDKELAQRDAAVQPAIRDLQAAAATYNRRHSLRPQRQCKTSVTGCAEAAVPTRKLLPAAVQRRRAWLTHLALAQPTWCRLVLLTYVNHCAAQPLLGLETYDHLAQRLVPNAPKQANYSPLAAALRELQDAVAYGVCQRTARRVRLGLHFVDPHVAPAIAEALQQGAVAAEFGRLLPDLGPRLPCLSCATSVFAVPLFYLAGLEDLRALCCPHCGRCLQRYRLPLGVDLQALFNGAYIQHGRVVSLEVQVGTATVLCQWAACQAPQLRLRDVKLRLQRHLFAANGLQLSVTQLRLSRGGTALPNSLPVQASSSLRLQVVKTMGLTTRQAVQQVQHAIAQRFAPGPPPTAISLHRLT
jgi:hypothetical protein